MTPLDTFTEALSSRGIQLRRSKDGWTARCPAHEDRNASMTVSEGSDGRVLVTCWANCTLNQIVEAVGLRIRDLFPAKEERPTITDTYTYQNPDETTRYQVVRFSDKQFRQRRPDGNGGWIWNLRDTERLLYHLPNVLRAAARGDIIYICEGEKDVHALEHAGVTATTNSGGAGKWETRFADTLTGASEVIIIADRDEPGLRHAEQIRASLNGTPSRIVQAKTGKDAADHIAAGHTLDQLEPLPQPEPDVDELEPHSVFRTHASEDVPVLIRGLWPKATLGFISGPPKSRKTWVALALGLSVASAKPLLGRFAVPEPQPVLYVALEGHRSNLNHRFEALAHGYNLDPAADLDNFYWWYKPRGINIAEPSWAAKLAAHAERIHAGIVIIDVLRAAAQIKENEASEFARLRASLDPILENGQAVALLHHFGKLSDTNLERAPAERMSGTGAMRGAADIGIYLAGTAKDPSSRVTVELRDLAEPDPFGIDLIGEGSGPNGGFTAHDTCRLVIRDAHQAPNPAQAWADWIRAQANPVSARVVKAQFDISDRTWERHAPALGRLGIARIGQASNTKYTAYETQK